MSAAYLRTTAGRPTLRSVAILALVVSLSAARAADEPNGVEKARSLSRAFRAAANKVIPTVVKIKTITKAKVIEGGRRLDPEGLLEDQIPGFRIPRGRIPQQSGVGSGVIIDPSGIILTNAHVVEGADEVLVELSDGRQLTGSAVRTDRDSDLAVLRVKSEEPLKAATLGDSEAMDIGDWVLAIGNPFELDHTVSAGIISGKQRALPSGKRASFLQTDAAINPGNSGGPLVNLDGEVVGINTAIASSSGGYQGVGFAIPSNQAKWVSDQLVKNGKVQRAYLGVAIGELNEPLARKLGLDRVRGGVLVNEVRPKTPAEAAGMQAGDVILKFSGKRVRTPRELQEVVERVPIDSQQPVEVFRDGKEKTLTVTVKLLPADFAAVGPAPQPAPDEQPSGLEIEGFGFRVSELTAEEARRRKAPGRDGVLVSHVHADGPAAQVGLREGMLILRVGAKGVKSVAELKAALKSESDKDGVMLLVRTAEGNRFVVLEKK